MGMAGYNVSNPDDVLPTLTKAFASDGPVLVNIMTDPNALAMPPKIEFTQMLGFAQTMYKLLMEGRSKEVWYDRYKSEALERSLLTKK